jgi:murein DD-endopeptidase MepM/ murein hydrolase activator NlpD
MRANARLYVAVAGAALSLGCEVVRREGTKQDTTTRVDTGAAAAARAAADTVRVDSLRVDSLGGPRDSVLAGAPAGGVAGGTATAPAADSGTVTIVPAAPRRGGVVFVLAEGLFPDAPRCTWKGEPVPCYRVPRGVRAVIPLPADAPGGTYTLTIDRPAGRVTRQIAVAERDFGGELIFLDPDKYALLRRRADIARDARALRQVLGTESAEQRWSGRWGIPLQGGRSTEYGVERFYYPASDSARAVKLTPDMRTRATFGLDTSSAREGEVPSWRHAGTDIPARRGTPVRAPAAGIVVDVGDYVLSGRTLVIDHGQGVLSAYFHLDSALVRRGDVVRSGAVVARVGSTGLATGPHLHYGIYVHGSDVDPAAWRALPEWMRGADTATRASRR